jgi:hypothetical protein
LLRIRPRAGTADCYGRAKGDYEDERRRRPALSRMAVTAVLGDYNAIGGVADRLWTNVVARVCREREFGTRRHDADQ